MGDALVARAPKSERVAPTQGYDPARLRRAVQLGGEQLGPRQFKVKGQDEPVYFVDLDGDPVCYCKDSEYHGRGCKHELFVRLRTGDMALIQALGDMLLAAQKVMDAATTKRRRRLTEEEKQKQ